MDKLISADALRDKLEEHRHSDSFCRDHNIDRVINLNIMYGLIADAPAVDRDGDWLKMIEGIKFILDAYDDWMSEEVIDLIDKQVKKFLDEDEVRESICKNCIRWCKDRPYSDGRYLCDRIRCYTESDFYCKYFSKGD